MNAYKKIDGSEDADTTSCLKGMYERLYWTVQTTVGFLKSYAEYGQWEFSKAFLYDTLTKKEISFANLNMYLDRWISSFKYGEEEITTG